LYLSFAAAGELDVLGLAAASDLDGVRAARQAERGTVICLETVSIHEDAMPGRAGGKSHNPPPVAIELVSV
jgi:hypothetical protein